MKTIVRTLAVIVTLSVAGMAGQAEPATVTLERGILYSQTEGKSAEAAALFEQVIREHPENRPAAAEAMRRLAVIRIMEGRDAESVQLLKKLASDYPEQAQAAADTNDPFAVQSSDPFMAKSEEQARAGWNLWRQRKLPEAEGLFESAVTTYPGNSNAWNGLGWSRSNQGKSKEAEVAFRKAIDLEPDQAAALNGLGWLAKGRGETQDAIGWWEKAIAANAGATAALNGLATTYAEIGDVPRAIEAYEKWLAAEPTNQEARTGLEKLRASTGPAAPAGALTARIEGRMKRVKERAEKGNVWKDKVDLASALDELAGYKAANPAQKQAYHDEAWAWGMSQHDEDATWRLFDLLASISWDMGEKEQAVEEMRKALEFYPDVEYSEPIKHSKYQHLVNKTAGMIWETEGADKALAMLVEQIEREPKMDAFFSGWWKERMGQPNSGLEEQAVIEAVNAAVAVRLINFPDDAKGIANYGNGNW